MLVREHGYEVEGFRPYVQKSVWHTGRDPRHIWPFHGKAPIADHVFNLAVQDDVRFLTVVRMQRRPTARLGLSQINDSASKP